MASHAIIWHIQVSADYRYATRLRRTSSQNANPLTFAVPAVSAYAFIK